MAQPMNLTWMARCSCCGEYRENTLRNFPELTSDICATCQAAGRPKPAVCCVQCQKLLIDRAFICDENATLYFCSEACGKQFHQGPLHYVMSFRG